MRYGFMLTILAATAAVPACSNSLDILRRPAVDAGVTNNVLPPAQSTTGGSGDTFDHDNNQISPWDLVNRLEIEGPPSFTSHMHSCSKVRYGNLGRVLASLGVNTTNATKLSAGELYTDGFSAMGGPDYANRVRENIDIFDRSQAPRCAEFDIFAAAAPEVIAERSRRWRAARSTESARRCSTRSNQVRHRWRSPACSASTATAGSPSTSAISPSRAAARLTVGQTTCRREPPGRGLHLRA